MKYRRSMSALAVSSILAAGCNRPAGPGAAPGAPSGPGTVNGTPGKPAAPVATVTDEELVKAKVNEAGVIPILEYHQIKAGKPPYHRSPEEFRKDLDRLYGENYRPISMHDLLDNRIDVPLGMTPFLFTFDDGDISQFHYLPNGSLDPDCAFGILKSFHESHPDFGMRAVFYLNAAPPGRPPNVFGQPDMAQKKLQELLAAGMELGNHTVNHLKLKKLSDANVQKELADCVAGIHGLAPNAVVDTFALPFGIWPKNRALAESGESGGVKYHNRAVLLVGANPTPAPASRKFNPLRLPRIQAIPGLNGSDYWLDKFREHPQGRYISDGDPATVSVPKSAEKKIDTAKLGAVKLRTYQATAADSSQ